MTTSAAHSSAFILNSDVNIASGNDDASRDDLSNFDNEYEFRFPDDYEEQKDNEDQQEVAQSHARFSEATHSSTLGGTDDNINSNRRTGRTSRWVGGYKYTQSNKNANTVYYRCSHYRTGCKGTCQFVRNLETYINFVPHTCGRSAVPAENANSVRSVHTDISEEMKRYVDQLAVTTTASRNAIWDTVRAKYYGNPNSNLSFSGLGREEVLRRVDRARAEEFGGSVYGQIEASPWSRVLNADGTASTTIFYLFHQQYYDKVRKKREKLLGWGHPILVNMLKQNKTNIFVDGTFRTVPATFKQCIIFSTYDRPTKAYFPAAFVLCTSKQYSMYFHAMSLLVDETDHAMNPEFVYCDFEAELIRAIRDHFPNTSIIGCLFHFKQACRRKMKKYGISDSECKIAMKSGVLDMLTVVKQDKLAKQGIKWVKQKISDKCNAKGVVISVDKWEKFWKYFKKTWIVRFPPSLWNVEPYTQTAISRTNNPLERFNREMNAAFPVPHPNPPDFVVGIEALARRYANLKYDIDIGRALAATRLPIILPTPVVLPETCSDSGSESSDSDEETLLSSDDEGLNVLRPDLRGFIPSRTEGPVTVSAADFGRITEDAAYYDALDEV